MKRDAMYSPAPCVLRGTLSNGRTLEVSGGHPLAAAGTFDDLEFTYDVLPASDTATYFAAGVRIGSTLAKLR